MNCQSFESIVNDLARGALIEASAREGAHAHTGSCARCAARLTDERALTEGLRSLADGAREAEAPARVEASLLAAFRARDWAADAANADAPGGEESRPDRGNLFGQRARAQTGERAGALSLWRLPRWAQGAAVAAASVLLVVGFYGLFIKRAGIETSDRAGVDKRASAEVAAPVESPSRAEATTAQSSPAVETDDEDVAADERRDGATTMAATPTPRAQRRAGGARPVEARYGSGGASRGLDATPAAAGNDRGAFAPSEVAEITTDFIPLVHDGLVSADSGHLVRVELPRSALAGFGLPLNAERAGQRVKADVLMGDDGIARAIRFVR